MTTGSRHRTAGASTPPRWTSRSGIWFPIAALVASCAEAAFLAQLPDVTKPPPILKSAGPFSATKLSRPRPLDGREWIAADVQTASAGTVSVPTRAFTLTLTDCGDHDGDFERCQLLFQRRRAPAVRIDNGFTGWVFVTPDSHYIVTEPLYVLDVREWKQYALFESLQIPNYTRLEAISRDGKRLFLSRRDCAIDCKDVRVDYYELTLP
jgi:hypothetical protein